MAIKVLKTTLKIQFVDDETGEVFESTQELGEGIAKKPSTKKKKVKNPIEEDPTPKVLREDNKLILNSAALQALGAVEGDRIAIKMQVINKKKRPVIGTDDSFGTKTGNLLTKSQTVRYAGKSNDELAKFGTEFILEEIPDKDGIFLLKVEGEEEKELTAPEINIGEEIDAISPETLDDAESTILDDLNFNIDEEL